MRFLLLLAVLYVFFISINLMGASLKALTKTTVKDILHSATENPFVGLLLGILTTSIIQSSSTTTSIVVGLAAFGTISLRGAIPIVMGANIGTTVTNTLVSFAHVRHKAEFERALAAGTVHDIFNIMATLVLFPLEIATHVLEDSALWIKELVLGTSVGEVPGLKTVIKPVVTAAMDLCQSPWVALPAALIVLFFSLAWMVKLMRAIFIARMAKALDRFLFRNAPAALVVGMIFTLLVQSSSVTTSLIVPLVGAGILTLEQVFPYTLGANIGTTVTAFMAALALAAGGQDASTAAGVGVTVAIVHLLFNVFGILIIYPVKFIPIWLARRLAVAMSVSRRRTALFLLLYFAAYLFPLALFLFL
ncbi:MAG: Na/Pi symporter [Planctomycetota bacterium]